ncbi:MAG: hypothetical protein K0R76_390 [Alphaproteobacteria bacterium]|nr:hypothetical protein [Alphaproteobacteria bacterium]
MACSLMVLKSRIPALEDHGGDDLGSHLGISLENAKGRSAGGLPLMTLSATKQEALRKAQARFRAANLHSLVNDSLPAQVHR